MFVCLPKYRDHKGSGQALIQINGHRISLGPFNGPESLEKYRRYIAQLAAPGSTVEDWRPDKPLTVNALILRYFRYAKTYFIGPQAQEVLLRHLARDAQAYCFRPCDSEEKRRAAVTAARTGDTVWLWQ